MIAPHRKRRSGSGLPTVDSRVVALSVSYEREGLLARGMGLEHLQELVARIVRPLLRRAEPRCSIAYAGSWAEVEESFTHMLLRLISAEQEENSLGGLDTNRPINPLINHSAWPNYLEISPKVEARWIQACRIVRISQEDAGIPVRERCPDDAAGLGDIRARHARAVTLSAMRRKTHEQLSLGVPDGPNDVIPAADARVVIGGRMNGYSGFIPGVLEEALVALENDAPLFVLGGFGGAAEVVARALLSGPEGIPELDYEWHARMNPRVEELLAASRKRFMPQGARDTLQLLKAFRAVSAECRCSLVEKLNTGLSASETQELMKTADIDKVVRLVSQGLETCLGFRG